MVYIFSIFQIRSLFLIHYALLHKNSFCKNKYTLLTWQIVPKRKCLKVNTTNYIVYIFSIFQISSLFKIYYNLLHKNGFWKNKYTLLTWQIVQRRKCWKANTRNYMVYIFSVFKISSLFFSLHTYIMSGHKETSPYMKPKRPIRLMYGKDICYLKVCILDCYF